jgi:hypothetical protein
MGIRPEIIAASGRLAVDTDGVALLLDGKAQLEIIAPEAGEPDVVLVRRDAL